LQMLLKDAHDKGVGQDLGRTVSLAVDAGAPDVLELLLEHRAEVNASDVCSRPPLLTATREGQLPILKVLCASETLEINAQDALGSSALHEAVFRESGEMVLVLLGRRADPMLQNRRGWTPLHVAAHLGTVRIIGHLVRAGAPADAESGVMLPQSNIEPTPRTGVTWSPLHLLLTRGDTEAVWQMIEWRADPCLTGGPDVLNPLMLAISLKHTRLALQLLALASVRERLDYQDRRGRCALHFAVGAQLAEVVRSILDLHANPSIRNRNSLTPLDVGREAAADGEICHMILVEEVLRLVMTRTQYRQMNKYEEADMLRGDLRLRAVTLDVHRERWSLPDGTWGYLSCERARAQAQGGPRFLPPNGQRPPDATAPAEAQVSPSEAQSSSLEAPAHLRQRNAETALTPTGKEALSPSGDQASALDSELSPLVQQVASDAELACLEDGSLVADVQIAARIATQD